MGSVKASLLQGWQPTLWAPGAPDLHSNPRAATWAARGLRVMVFNTFVTAHPSTTTTTAPNTHTGFPQGPAWFLAHWSDAHQPTRPSAPPPALTKDSGSWLSGPGNQPMGAPLPAPKQPQAPQGWAARPAAGRHPGGSTAGGLTESRHEADGPQAHKLLGFGPEGTAHLVEPAVIIMKTKDQLKQTFGYFLPMR